MRNPILMRGELYTKTVEKRQGAGGEKRYRRTYEESRIDLISDIETVLNNIEERSEAFLKNKTYCIRLDPGFDAKSYAPSTLFKIDDVNLIGGRKYHTAPDGDAKLYFAKGTEKGLGNILEALSDDRNTSGWEENVRSINKIDLLTKDEKIAGFPEDWEEGQVEIVLHPEISDDENELKYLMDHLGISEKECASKRYDGGPIFCSVHCSKEQLSSLSELNYVRTVHPMDYEGIGFRQSSVKPVTAGPIPDGIPKKTIGIFDGGVSIAHPILGNYVSSYDLTELDPVPDMVEHGTAVCSAAIFGSIGDHMPEPNVHVNSYRIHPMPKGDIYSQLELYEIIDKIEETVEKATEDVYSISFGPRGAIIDDEVSRFTYSLDRLSLLERKPLFCVATGNTGDLPFPVNRIHAPADMVNGIAVGAYTYDLFSLQAAADYSSCGPGREGCKVKPDILEFGGSEEHPVNLLSSDPDVIMRRYGTSFSAPILAGKIGRMLSESDDLDAHMARTLVIHTADSHKEIETKRAGHGFCKRSFDDMLSCSDNRVLTTYKGQIKPSKYMRVDILIPSVLCSKDHQVNISWTVVCISRPNHNDVDSYTGNCLEDTFHPDKDVFNYRKEKIVKHARIGSEEERTLIRDGFRKSKYPKSMPSTYAINEMDERKLNLKWDTVVKKYVNLGADELNDPHLVLHANTRDGDTAATEYYAAISVEAPGYRGNLYAEIVKEYVMLTPIRLRNTSRIDIRG